MRRAALQALASALTALALVGCPGQPVSTCQEEGSCGPDGEVASTPPRLEVRPAFGLGFACVAIGCDEARQVTIANRGGGVLSLTSARLTAGTSPDFSIQTAAPLPIDLGPDHETTLTVTFIPRDAREDYGVLKLYTTAQPAEGATAGEIDLPLRARQNGDPVLGLAYENDVGQELALEAEGYVINFGYVEGCSVGRRDLIVRNLTNGNAILELLEVVPGADYEPAFYITPLLAADRLVNPGEETRVELQLSPGSTPRDLRLYQAEVLVRTSDPFASETAIHLFGTAMNVALIEATPAAIDFGSTRMGQPVSREITLRNNGGVELLVTPELVAGANVGFAAPADGTTLAPVAAFGQSTVEVRLEATVGGAATGILRLLSNDPLNGELDVALSGFVDAPLLAVAPDPIAFGSLVQSWSADPISAVVSNEGHGPLEITGVRFEVGSSSQFSLQTTPSLPLSLLPEDPPVEIEVGYTAYNLGPAEALLVLESNTVDVDRTEVSVSGTGVTCEQGCVLPHATPSCTHGACAVQSCEAGYHDGDGVSDNGCECHEESPEVGSFCSEASYVGTVKDTTKTKIGNLHDLNDVDNYWFFAEDASDFCFPGRSDDGEIKVDFQSAPGGIEFCVSYVDHQDSGDGCGLGNESCGHRSWEFDDTSCGGSDDRDVTVRVRVTPGEEPSCAEYTIRFKSSM